MQGLVVFLAKQWAETRIKKAVEHEYNSRLEHLKSTLAKEQYKHNVTFEKTANATVESFRLLLQYKASVETYLNTCTFPESTISDADNIRKSATIAKSQLDDYLEKNDIFMVRDSALWMAYVSNMYFKQELLATMSIRVRLGGHSPFDGGKNWDAQISEIQKEIPKLLEVLRDCIQTDLGITPPPSD